MVDPVDPAKPPMKKHHAKQLGIPALLSVVAAALYVYGYPEAAALLALAAGGSVAHGARRGGS